MSATGAEFRKVLVIDDSDIVLESCRSILERAGYRVITRNRPSGSITAILNERPDVVLLDLNMPSLSGEAILKVLGKSQNRPDTMVLLHSSLPLETLRLKAVTTGAHGYIQKTENNTEFLRRLEYWIRKTHQTSSARVRAIQLSEEFDAPIAELREPELLPPREAFAPMMPSPRGPTGYVGPIAHSPPILPTAKTLFVDDDWIILNTYKTAIGSEVDAEYVASGEEAIARLISSTPPQIVVCDLVMPFLTGADVYRRALAYEGSWSQRFVFVTGAASQRSVADVLNGVDAKIFFTPVPPDRLLEAIRKVEETLPAR
jgi:two-component system, OmpR family, response regulator